MLRVCIIFIAFLYTNMVIITVIDEYKYSHTVTLYLHFTCVTFVIVMMCICRQFIAVCMVVQNCCKGRPNKYRKWHFYGCCGVGGGFD